MKSFLVFTCGAAAGAAIAFAGLRARATQAEERFGAEKTELQQRLARVEQNAKRSEDGWQAALRALQAARAPEAAATPSTQTSGTSASAASSAGEAAPAAIDAAMGRYLGEPVLAPAGMNPAYAPDALLGAFKTLCQTRGVVAEKVGVDTSEFPFILHGVIESGRDFSARDFLQRVDADLRALPGYTYGGSVTGRTKSGSAYFALNMTPSSAYPREQAEAIRRRLMLRLQMTAAAWTDSVR